MNPLFSSQTLTILEKALDSSSLRQKVISNNVANVNTPGFKRSDVIFEETLTKTLDKAKVRLQGTDANHISAANSVSKVKPEVVRDSSTSMRNDGNNVDIDKEMTLMAMNQIYYNALVQRISGKYSSLKHVISEGRR